MGLTRVSIQQKFEKENFYFLFKNYTIQKKKRSQREKHKKLPTVSPSKENQVNNLMYLSNFVFYFPKAGALSCSARGTVGFLLEAARRRGRRGRRCCGGRDLRNRLSGVKTMERGSGTILALTLGSQTSERDAPAPHAPRTTAGAARMGVPAA